MEINGAEINNEELKTLPCILLEIHAAKKETFVISSEKISRRTADVNLKANNRGYVQFLELILNQTCIRETYVQKKNRFFFEYVSSELVSDASSTAKSSVYAHKMRGTRQEIMLMSEMGKNCCRVWRKLFNSLKVHVDAERTILQWLSTVFSILKND